MLSGCGGGSAPQNTLLTSLRSAPERITMRSVPLQLEAFLWRDFMPGPVDPKKDSRMIGVVRVQSINNAPLPSGMRPEKIWVIYGEEVWEPTIHEEKLEQPSVVGLSVRQGPLWPIDSRVDVVVQLRDSADQTYLLQGRNQKINATF
jgi:hypothetical protein